MLPKLMEAATAGDDYLHEIKHDGYRLHARLVDGGVQLLTRRALNWAEKYPGVAAAIAALPAANAYIDGEVCVLDPDTGVSSFRLLQAAGRSKYYVYFAFDLLHLDGEPLLKQPLTERKTRLAQLLSSQPEPVRLAEHIQGNGQAMYRAACELNVEGIVSKRAGSRYVAGDEREWLKVKCLNGEEFIIVGWSEPERSRHRLGSLLLAYYTPDGRLWYAGRVGTGMSDAELERLWRMLQPLAIDDMPLAEKPPPHSHFGRTLELAKVHWMRPELSPRSRSRPGPPTRSCGTSPTRDCGRTSSLPMSCGSDRNKWIRLGPARYLDITTHSAGSGERYSGAAACR